jgi:hypothetical protein
MKGISVLSIVVGKLCEANAMENRKENQNSSYYNQGLNLPNWNENLKVLSPNLPRSTPARSSFKLGAPQVLTPFLKYSPVRDSGSSWPVT